MSTPNEAKPLVTREMLIDCHHKGLQSGGPNGFQAALNAALQPIVAAEIAAAQAEMRERMAQRLEGILRKTEQETAIGRGIRISLGLSAQEVRALPISGEEALGKLIETAHLDGQIEEVEKWVEHLRITLLGVLKGHGTLKVEIMAPVEHRLAQLKSRKARPASVKAEAFEGEKPKCSTHGADFVRKVNALDPRDSRSAAFLVSDGWLCTKCQDAYLSE